MFEISDHLAYTFNCLLFYQICFNISDIQKLFVLILYVPVNNFSVILKRVFLGRANTKQRIKYLAQGHNTATASAVRLELVTL